MSITDAQKAKLNSACPSLDNISGVALGDIIQDLQSSAGVLDYKGVWNATTNVPELSNSGGGGEQNDFYIINVAGTTEIDGEDDWKIGDWIVNNGTQWNKIDNTEPTVNPRGSATTIGEVVDALNNDISGLINDTGDFLWAIPSSIIIQIDVNNKIQLAGSIKLLTEGIMTLRSQDEFGLRDNNLSADVILSESGVTSLTASGGKTSLIGVINDIISRVAALEA